ncbi:MAG: hypothetical protein K0S23_3003 [Fluviicola sp.]|jgi:hypothetical protein|uniref:hypothetical protein n=1 Tax=Fluviicola sp. TaxID=1917219 RepID=UPI00261302F6|nr:hypothetical protein [Fluviicola sp.]MDF3028696.1 hypothetical protein [Fluviicola sp.]
MSLENLNNSNREFQSLQKSFENWDAGIPSSDVWENLEADLAVSAVWDRLDESLEASGSSADKGLVESYENWSPNNSGDGWSKLEEQLSRERVWNRLNSTLSYPVSTRIPWMKMAAASVIFVFLAFYTDHYMVSNKEQRTSFAFNTAENGTVSGENKDQVIASSNPAGNNASADEEIMMVSENPGLNKVQIQQNVQKELLVTNKEPEDFAVVKNNEIGLHSSELNVNPNLVQNKELVNTSNEQTLIPVDTDEADLDVLARKEIPFVPGVIGDFTFLPYKPVFRPKFSVLVGGQFAFINEKNRSAFSSSIPSMGIAGDFQYHAYLGKVRFTQDLGFSQYAQSNGSYVNGRYTSSNQKLNTIHLSSSVGYTFKGGLTVYGGVALNRLLNGYEESRTAITNVYNSNKLQLGATAGIDYHFTPFKNRTALGLGIQYQFVSRLKSENAVFDDIQGVKLQIKYSF